ncbi:MAG: hypothetical protein R2779_10100 [Crocinitomicaceae bacterium]
MYSHYSFDNMRNQLIGRVNVGFLKYFNAGITGRVNVFTNIFCWTGIIVREFAGEVKLSCNLTC